VTAYVLIFCIALIDRSRCETTRPPVVELSMKACQDAGATYLRMPADKDGRIVITDRSWFQCIEKVIK
jgi:hypothetical protein